MMALTAEEQKNFRDWELGRIRGGEFAKLGIELPRKLFGPGDDLVKSYQYKTLRAGDPVTLDGRFLADRVQWATDIRWEFICFVTNVKTGAQWIELYGRPAQWAQTFGVLPEAAIDPRVK